MIKRNARLCTLATVLFIGSNMNASTFICPKDNTMIAKQAEITGKYKSQRPADKPSHWQSTPRDKSQA